MTLIPHQVQVNRIEINNFKTPLTDGVNIVMYLPFYIRLKYKFIDCKQNKK